MTGGNREAEGQPCAKADENSSASFIGVAAPYSARAYVLLWCR